MVSISKTSNVCEPKMSRWYMTARRRGTIVPVCWLVGRASKDINHTSAKVESYSNQHTDEEQKEASSFFRAYRPLGWWGSTFIPFWRILLTCTMPTDWNQLMKNETNACHWGMVHPSPSLFFIPSPSLHCPASLSRVQAGPLFSFAFLNVGYEPALLAKFLSSFLFLFFFLIKSQLSSKGSLTTKVPFPQHHGTTFMVLSAFNILTMAKNQNQQTLNMDLSFKQTKAEQEDTISIKTATSFFILPSLNQYNPQYVLLGSCKSEALCISLLSY